MKDGILRGYDQELLAGIGKSDVMCLQLVNECELGG